MNPTKLTFGIMCAPKTGQPSSHLTALEWDPGRNTITVEGLHTELLGALDSNIAGTSTGVEIVGEGMTEITDAHPVAGQRIFRATAKFVPGGNFADLIAFWEEKGVLRPDQAAQARQTFVTNLRKAR